MAVAETMQSLSTVAETWNVVVAGLACAEADVEVMPNARNPSRAADMADLTTHECFIEMTPGNWNSEIGQSISTSSALRNSTVIKE
jgi:hypothetical protein